MSWPQWNAQAPPSASVLNPSTPAINPAPSVMPPGMQYTPEQWAQLQQQNWNQWAQWQQQYQQWHQQYGAEYQKSMNAIAQASQQPVTLPNVSVPPPPPVEAKPPLPSEDPPPSGPLFASAPPLLQQGYSTAASHQNDKPQILYKNQPQNYFTAQNSNKRSLDQPTNVDHKRRAQWNQSQPPPQFQQPPPLLQQPPPQLHQPRPQHLQSAQQQSSMQRMPQPRFNQPPPLQKSPARGNAEELSEAEKKFDKQFAEWEAQFNKWKEQNVEHPDKEQYKEYEKKWDSWRTQLLDRREQMRRKRLGLNVPQNVNQSLPSQHKNLPSIQPSTIKQPSPSPNLNQPPPKVTNAAKSMDTPFNRPPPNLNDEPLSFKQPTGDDLVEDFIKPNTEGGIPGLDLVTEEPIKKADNEPIVIEDDKVKKGPDLDAISKGINTILGDQKLLNMLSLVSQGSAVKNTEPITSTPANEPEFHSQVAPFHDQSNQSFEEHSNKSDIYSQKEVINNFDDQTRSSFTTGYNEPEMNYNRQQPPPKFNNTNWGNDQFKNFNSRFDPLPRPNQERQDFGGDERFGYSQDRFNMNRGSDRFPNRNQEWFQSRNTDRVPNQDRFPNLNQERFQNRNPGQFYDRNQTRFPPNQNSFNSNQRHGFGENQNFDEGSFEQEKYDYDGNEEYEVNFEPEEPEDFGAKSNEQEKPVEETANSNEEELPILKPATVIDYDHKSLKSDEPEILVEPLYMFDYRHKPISRIPLPQRPKWLYESVKGIPEFDPPVVRPYDPPQLRRLEPRRTERIVEEDYHNRSRRFYDDRRPYSRPIYDDFRDNKNEFQCKREEKKAFPAFPRDLEEEKISDTEFPDDDEFYNEECSKPIDELSRFQRPDLGSIVQKKNILLIDDILSPPGRYNRAPRIVIILRGPPGSGKTYLAKLIKDKEVENGGSPPRILSLDDYFMVEQEKEVTEDGKKVTIKEMVYEFEGEMEESYRSSLIKSFKKTITDGYFPFIIVDNINDKVKYFGEMWSFAKQNGFQVYICQLEFDVQTCTKRNIHGRSESDIEKCIKEWEPTPSHHPILDAASLFKAGSIPDVEMEEVNSPESDVVDCDASEDHVARSKWDNFDCSVLNLAKLDGVSRPLRPSRTMEEYLQLDSEWTPVRPTKPGQKRVRWADLEEQKQQEKMRAIGFVVGQTNWDRMMDPTNGGSALTQTKYIERTGRYRVDQK